MIDSSMIISVTPVINWSPPAGLIGQRCVLGCWASEAVQWRELYISINTYVFIEP